MLSYDVKIALCVTQYLRCCSGRDPSEFLLHVPVTILLLCFFLSPVIFSPFSPECRHASSLGPWRSTSYTRPPLPLPANVCMCDFFTCAACEVNTLQSFASPGKRAHFTFPGVMRSTYWPANETEIWPLALLACWSSQGSALTSAETSSGPGQVHVRHFKSLFPRAAFWHCNLRPLVAHSLVWKAADRNWSLHRPLSIISSDHPSFHFDSL